MNDEEINIDLTFSGIYKHLLEHQVDLDTDFVKILNDNFWDLLVS